MQLFVRFGSAVDTVAVEVSGEERVRELRQQVAERAGALVPPSQLRLIYGGRQLAGSTRLSETGVQHGSTLFALARLLGGGGDGGSTGAESRSCYLEMYATKKADKIDPLEQLRARWTRCHLSGEPLAPPVVADALGNLYNKDAVLHALLHKTLPKSLASYITGLKALTELKLAKNPAERRQAARNGGAKAGTAAQAAEDEPEFQCPISGQGFNGRYRFVVHRPSGQVVSERALKEVPAAVQELFGSAWTAEDLITVNPSGDELDAMKEKLADKLQAEREAKDKKKDKKRKKAEADGAADAAVATTSAAAGAPVAAPGKVAPPGAEAAAVAALAAADAAVGAPGAKKAKKGTALEHLSKHATAEVYASLFSSSRPEGEKETFCCRNTSGRGWAMS